MRGGRSVEVLEKKRKKRWCEDKNKKKMKKEEQRKSDLDDERLRRRCLPNTERFLFRLCSAASILVPPCLSFGSRKEREKECEEWMMRGGFQIWCVVHGSKGKEKERKN